MELQILFLSISVAIILPLIALHYLSQVLHAVLMGLCGGGNAADFWLRCIHILAVSGSLVLVITCVPTYDGVHWLTVIRSVLIWTSAGIFLAVAIVAKSVWNNAVKPAIDAANRSAHTPLSQAQLAGDISTGATLSGGEK